MNGKLMIANVLLAAGVVSLFGASAQAQNRMGGARSGYNAGVVSAADRKFAMAAAHGGIAEVRLGELAAKRGSSEFVRQFGQQMVEDHGKANEDLMSVASNLKLTLPTEPDTEQRDLLARLRRLHGAAFDSAYIKAMKMDHRMDIAEFKREANQGNGPIRRFAERTLPVVQGHYRMLQNRRMM